MLCDLRVDASSLPSLPCRYLTRLAMPAVVALSAAGQDLLRWRAPALTQLPWVCKTHATRLPAPDDPRSPLQRKAHGPRGSVEGRPRVNVAVLIGCQVSAGWHAPRRLTARIVMPPRDGNASSPPVLTTANASSTYVWTRAGMPTQRMVREAT
jgi:hypothetical protein